LKIGDVAFKIRKIEEGALDIREVLRSGDREPSVSGCYRKKSSPKIGGVSVFGKNLSETGTKEPKKKGKCAFAIGSKHHHPHDRAGARHLKDHS